MLWRNCVYDTVLGGGKWSRWVNIGNIPDTSGARYNAETGGNTVNWLAGSYACEGFTPIEAFKPATKILFVTPGTPTATGRETGTAENPFRSIATAQAAAAALVPTVNNWISIVLLPGLYQENVTTTSAYVDFVGLGARDEVVITPVSAPGVSTLTIAHSNVNVRNLTLISNDASATGRPFAISGSQTGVRFHNVKFYRAFDVVYSPAVYINNVLEAEFYDCHFAHINTGANRYAFYAEVSALNSVLRFFNSKFDAEFHMKGGTYILHNCAISSTGPQAVVLNVNNASEFRMTGGSITCSTGDGINIVGNNTLTWDLKSVKMLAGAGFYDVKSAVGVFPGTMLGCTMARGLGLNVILSGGLNRPVGLARDFVPQYLYTDTGVPTNDLIGQASIDTSNWWLAGSVLHGTLSRISFEVVATITSVGGAGIITLYDVGPSTGPPAIPTPIASLTAAPGSGGPQVLSSVLTVSAAGPGANVLSNTARMYEVRCTLAGAAPGDTFLIGGGGIKIL